MIEVKKAYWNKNLFYYETRRKCDCPCHDPNKAIMHFMDCCRDGWIVSHIYIKLLTKRDLFVMNNKIKINLLQELNIIVPKSFREFAIKYPK